MRKIERIIVHCSAGNQRNTAAEIVNFHLRPKSENGRGWSKPGYHYIIEADGTIVSTWPLEKSSNGVNARINPTAINICYIGGVDVTRPGLPPVDNRTPAQKEALRRLLKELRAKFPEARIHSHRDFAAKACPSFDATSEYADI